VAEIVPVRFRDALSAIVAHVAEGDFAALIREGSSPAGTDLGRWVRQHPAHVIPLPPEAWQIARCGRVTNQPGTWWVEVPLWTAEEGRSDLSLEATIAEDDGRFMIQIDGIHVL
jgi:hypothetical protein